MIYFKNVKKCYENKKYVLNSLSFNINLGKIVSLIGPSGCGKSTILQLAAGLINPTKGNILINGERPSVMRNKMSFVFQNSTLLPWLTVEKNVELPLKIQNVDVSKRKNTVQQLLELVNLAYAAKYYPRQLSRGMSMKVSIIRALTKNPDILLMDEPFGSIDEINRNKINEDFLTIGFKKNWTILFVTHSIAEAVYLSSKIYIMNSHSGCIVQIIDVDFPYPRPLELRMTLKYQAKITEVMKAFYQSQKS